MNTESTITKRKNKPLKAVLAICMASLMLFQTTITSYAAYEDSGVEISDPGADNSTGDDNAETDAGGETESGYIDNDASDETDGIVTSDADGMDETDGIAASDADTPDETDGIATPDVDGMDETDGIVTSDVDGMTGSADATSDIDTEDVDFGVFEVPEIGMRVAITAPYDAFPEGTQVSVSYVNDKPEVTDVIKDALIGEVTIENLYTVDISFTADGEEVQPSGAVNVVFDSIEGTAEKVAVFHDNDGDLELVANEINEGTVEIETDAFSEYYVATYDYEISGVKEVTNEAGFRDALKNGKSVSLKDDITLSNNTTAIPEGDMIYVYLNGHTITVGQHSAEMFRLGKGSAMTVIGGTFSGAQTSDSAGYVFECVGTSAERTKLVLGDVTVTGFRRTFAHAGSYADIIAEECKFTDNSVADYGAAFRGHGNSSIKIVNCSFERNKAGGDGGAINVNTADIITEGTNYFIGNISGNRGGAISVEATVNPMNLTGCRFLENTASGEGGAVRYKGNGKQLTLSGSMFEENISNSRGGAVFVDSAPCVIEGSVFNGNASNLNSWGDGGGAVAFAGAYDLTIDEDSDFENNYAYSSGGAIAFKGSNASKITINGTYVNNIAEHHEGGAIIVNSADGKMAQAELVSGLFEGNKTGYTREGTRWDGYYDWGGGAIFVTDKANILVPADTLIYKNYAGGYGGGIAGCSTGRVFIYGGENGHPILFDNSAEGTHLSGSQSSKSDDRSYAAKSDVFLQSGFQDFYCALTSVVSRNVFAKNISGSIDLVPIDPNETGYFPASYATGITSTGYEAREAAVVIRGNYSATHGGGILCNGYIVVGDPENAPRLSVGKSLAIEATKLLRKGNQRVGQNKDEFGFILSDDIKGENVILTGTNDTNGNIVFGGKLSFDQTNFLGEGDNSTYKYIYYLQEADITNSQRENVVKDDSIYRIEIPVKKETVIQTIGDVQFTTDKYKIMGDEVKVYLVSKNADTGEYQSDEDTGGYQSDEASFTYSTSDESHADTLTLTPESYTFTNSIEESVSINGVKTWKDDDEDERPESITIRLWTGEGNNKKEIDYKTVRATDDWKWNFGSRSKYDKNGNEINYSITEDSVENYDSVVDGFNVTNTFDPHTTEIRVIKIWNDKGDEWGMRPDSLTFTVKGFDGDKQVVADRKVVITRNADEKMSVSDDGNDRTKALTVSEGGDRWEYVITGLPEKVKKKTITYRVYESSDSDGAGYYTGAVSEGVEPDEKMEVTFTNTFTQENITINGAKSWEDENNKYESRPESINIKVYSVGTGTNGEDELVKTETVSGDNISNDGWAWEITTDEDGKGLPKYKNKKPVTYRVEEEKTGDLSYYSTSGAVTGTVNEGKVLTANFTNTYNPETVDITVNKIWNDDGNRDGKRGNITVQLYRTITDASGIKKTEAYGEPVILTAGDSNGTAENVWSYTWEGLPRQYRNQDVSYSVAEIKGPKGYTASTPKIKNDGTEWEITNLHKPETISISGSKYWDDDGDRDNVRPISVTFGLYYANNDPVKDANGNPLTVTASEDTEWKWTFDGLPKNEYKDGKSTPVTYIVRELELSEEYRLSGVYSGNTIDEEHRFKTPDNADYAIVSGQDVSGIVFVNTHKIFTRDLSGTKVWDDKNDNDRVRPDGIIIKVYDADDPDTPIKDSEEKDDLIAEITNNADGTQTWSFRDLPMYKKVGSERQEIEYVAKEVGLRISDADGNVSIVEPYDESGVFKYNTADIKDVEYTQSIVPGPPYTFVNTYKTKTTDIKIIKVWDDKGNRDGFRPTGIELELYADDHSPESQGAKSVKTVKVMRDSGDENLSISEDKNLSISKDGNSWTYRFTGLNMYKNGSKIDYSVEETGVYYLDNQGQEHYARVEAGADNTMTLVIDKGDSESTDDDKTVVYKMTKNDDGNIVNTYDTQKISIQGTKIWDDNENADGVRPDAIVMGLYTGTGADTEPLYTNTVRESDGWKWNWDDLNKYKKGEIIEYTVRELGVYYGEKYIEVENGGFVYEVGEGENRNSFIYTSTITEAQSESESLLKVNVTNSYTPETVELTVTKEWKDDENRDRIRPDSVKVSLKANGEVVSYKAGNTQNNKTGDDAEGETEFELNEANKWTYTFSDLPKYSGGIEIAYTISEVSVPAGYTSGQSRKGNVITVTNSYTPEKVIVSGDKIWQDALMDGDRVIKDNADDLRPAEVRISLVAKVGDRQIDINADPQITTADEDWYYEFRDLNKNDENGNPITYSVKEDPVPGYETAYGEPVVEDNNITIDVTNIHNPERISADITKIWDDDNDRDGIRSKIGTIRIELYRHVDGEETEEYVTEADITVDGGNYQTYSFNGLEKYRFDKNTGAGDEYIYTIKEAAPDADLDYSASYGNDENGLTVTNTHSPELTEVNVEKIWLDEGNQDGSRPDSITLKLYDRDDMDNPVRVAKNVTGSKTADKWIYTFDKLLKYKNGSEIQYVVIEDPVESANGSRNADGTVRKYVTEYPDSGDGTRIINRYDTDKINVTVKKAWDDDDNRDGKRPAAITLNLKTKDDPATIISTVKLGETEAEGIIVPDRDENGVWVYTFSGPDGGGLDKYAGGKEIEYVVEEVLEDGSVYTPEYGYEPETDSLVIINRHTPEYVKLEIDKHWIIAPGDDLNVKDVTVEITGRLDDQTTVVEAISRKITADDGWRLILDPETDKLPRYHEGRLINYYVNEILPEDATYAQTNESGTMLTGDNAIIKAEAEDTDAAVTALHADLYNLPITERVIEKVWENDPAGFHGGVSAVDVTLRKSTDGESFTDYRSHEIRMDGEGDWKYTFRDLPAYEIVRSEDGSTEIRRVVYTVREDTRLENYNNNGEPQIISGDDDKITIINTLDGLDLKIEKKWLADNEAKRPASITVNVLSSVDIRHNATSVFERFKKIFGIDSEKWYLYDTIELKATDGWKGTLTDQLPRYVMEGGRIVAVSYALEEVGVPEGYSFDAANIDSEGNAVLINTGDTAVAGFKVWDDMKDVYGYRPTPEVFAANLVLLKNGMSFLTGADTEHFRWIDTTTDSWSYEFYDLPTGFDYTVNEKETVTGYTAPVINGFTITNPLDYTELTVKKIWDDNDNKYASRPENVSFTLLVGGKEAQISGVQPKIDLGHKNNESYTWKNLPRVDKDGKVLEYSVKETTVPTGYSSSIKNNGSEYTVTNTYSPEITTLTVRKVWDDLNDAAGRRPGVIQVALVRNGEDIDTVTLRSSNEWTYTWNDLPTILADGKGTKAVYSVREVSVISGYSVSVTGSGRNYIITNYYRAPSTSDPDPSGGDTPTIPSTPTTPTTPTTPGTPTTPDSSAPDNSIPTPDPYTIPDEPTPLAGASQVLGARRSAAGSVLGARRSPQTGDSSSVGAFVSSMAAAGAMMGAWFSMRRRRNKK